MTQPITVYPRIGQGNYATQLHRRARRILPFPDDQWYCVRCLQLLDTGGDPHWLIGEDFYCHRCVVVAGEEEGP